MGILRRPCGPFQSVYVRVSVSVSLDDRQYALRRDGRQCWWEEGLLITVGTSMYGDRRQRQQDRHSIYPHLHILLKTAIKIFDTVIYIVDMTWHYCVLRAFALYFCGLFLISGTVASQRIYST